jgi:hypothetical protein
MGSYGTSVSPVRRHADAALALVAFWGLALTLDTTMAIAGPPSSPTQQDLVQCEPIVSFEKRLRLERWSPASDCDRPTKARITDFFLGYSCVVEEGIDACRSFIPGPGSRDLDTAKGFRCLELSLTMDFDGDYHVHRLREWATAPTECEWDPNKGLLATEVDFDESQVCAAGACIPFQQLSGIGKARLKYLVLSAFRNNGVTTSPDQGPPASSVAFETRFAKRPARPSSASRQTFARAWRARKARVFKLFASHPTFPRSTVKVRATILKELRVGRIGKSRRGNAPTQRHPTCRPCPTSKI